MAQLARWIDALRQDLAYTTRGLRRDPRFSAMVVATLSLGIGASAALFSLADRLFFRHPAGVVKPDELATHLCAHELDDRLGHRSYRRRRVRAVRRGSVGVVRTGRAGRVHSAGHVQDWRRGRSEERARRLRISESAAVDRRTHCDRQNVHGRRRSDGQRSGRRGDRISALEERVRRRPIDSRARRVDRGAQGHGDRRDGRWFHRHRSRSSRRLAAAREVSTRPETRYSVVSALALRRHRASGWACLSASVRCVDQLRCDHGVSSRRDRERAPGSGHGNDPDRSDPRGARSVDQTKDRSRDRDATRGSRHDRPAHRVRERRESSARAWHEEAARARRPRRARRVAVTLDHAPDTRVPRVGALCGRGRDAHRLVGKRRTRADGAAAR